MSGVIGGIDSNSGTVGKYDRAHSVGLKSQQIFTTAGANTWTKPSGINTIKVYITGGGGGGGGKTGGNEDKASGGGAGGTALEIIDVSSISSVTVTIGAGGAGGADGNNNGVSGGSSSFGSYCSATGGTFGIAANQGNKRGGTGGIGSGGDLNMRGNSGQSMSEADQWAAGRQGGSSFWGGVGIPPGYDDVAGADSVMGSGGAGGDFVNTAGTATDGGAGICVVEEYS